MSARRNDPPKIAEALLELLLPSGGIRESVLGDLHELYQERRQDPESGPVRARLWYWRQAIPLAAGYGLRRLRGKGFRSFAPPPRPASTRGDGAAGVIRQCRYALRSLIRSPGFTLPALLILSVGMAAATAIFTVVDAVVFRPLPYPDADRLVLVCEDHARMQGICVASPGNAADLAARSRTLSEVGIARGRVVVIEDASGRLPLRGGLATGDFFRVLGVEPHLGRLFTDEEQGPDRSQVLLISHALWTTHFGADPSVVGSTVRVEGAPTVIVGVLPSGFDAPLELQGILAWRPPSFDLLDPEVRGWRGWGMFGRLAPDATLETARPDLEAAYASLAREHEEIDEEWRIVARPLIDAVVGDTRPVLLAFLVAAALLLLIVCANVSNLLLARGLGRRRELAVRAALGAERRRLVWEMLGESLLLTGLATGLALVLAAGATRLLVQMAPAELPRLDEVVMDGRVLAAAALVSVLVTAMFAVIPALHTTGWDLAQTLKSGARAGRTPGSARLRSALVVAEVALSVILVASAILLYRTLTGYMAWEPGFDRESSVTLTVYFPFEKYETRTDLVPVYREAEERLRALPGVASAATASSGPLFGGGDGREQFAVQDWDGASVLPSAAWFDVGPGFFATLGVPLRAGREIAESDDASATPVVVVNEALARLAWPDRSALGEVIRIPTQDLSLEVVGVVADVPPLTPGQAPEPQMYWSNRQLGRWGTFVLLRTRGDPAAAGQAAVETLRGLDPDLTVGTPRTIASAERRALVRPRFQAIVLMVFGLASLALSTVGVYAVVSYSVERRVREMGIRVALGADSGSVLALVMRSSLRTIGMGLVLGLAGTLAIGGYLSGMLYGVRASDPASLVLAVAVLLLAAVAASLLPARRATTADPVSAIKAS